MATESKDAQYRQHLTADRLRYENLAKEFKKIQTYYKVCTELPIKNTSQHLYYKDYYNKESKDLVAKMYEEEIDLLKYTY